MFYVILLSSTVMHFTYDMDLYDYGLRQGG